MKATSPNQIKLRVLIGFDKEVITGKGYPVLKDDNIIGSAYVSYSTYPDLYDVNVTFHENVPEKVNLNTNFAYDDQIEKLTLNSFGISKY